MTSNVEHSISNLTYLQTVDHSNNGAANSWPSHTAAKSDHCENQVVTGPWTIISTAVMWRVLDREGLLCCSNALSSIKNYYFTMSYYYNNYDVMASPTVL